MTHIEKNLSLLRRSNKRNQTFTQKDISELSLIPQTHISRLENGKESARLVDVMFYSRYFDVSIDDIVYKEYNPKTKKFEYPD